MSCGPRHTVLTAGRTSGGSCNLGGGRVGMASVSSGQHPSCGINSGRANFSSWSHVGGGGRSHFSSGSCSGAFVGGGHVGGSGGFGAGSHVGSVGGGHVGMVCGMPGGVPAGMVGGPCGVVGGVPAGMVGGMGGVVGGVPAGMVGGMGGVVGGVPAGMVAGMGGVVGGVPAGMVGGPCGVVGGVPAEMVGGPHTVVGGVPAEMVGGMGGVVGGVPPGMVGGPHTVVGGVPAGMVGGMGGVVPGPAVIGGLGGEHVCRGNFDGKMTMQNLNDRLASYLDKVRCLEEENAELECRIRDFYAKQGSLCEPKDYTHYHQKIEDLKNQVICTSVENNKLLLCIDNSKLTADDFRTKFETECCLRQNVEADINGLHQILDQLTACRANLEVQSENLQDELCGLKKNHKEEVTCLKSQSTGDVNVEVNASPGPDLKKILEEMRCKYEAMIEGNRKEVEAWYESKIEEVNRDVCTSSQEIEESNNKVTELRRQLQTLEIDLDAQCSLRDTLEGSLGETELRYNKHLAELQERISCLEQQLAELRAEMECQNHDYTELLDVKSRLEQEIATYRGLLEGGQHDIIGGGGAARASSASGRRSGDTRTSHTYVTHSTGHLGHGGHLHH